LKPAVFLPPAEEEMVEAARFYERRRSGLGADFLGVDAEEIVIVAVMHLRRRPDYWRVR
jgi:hypothetical protein